jgi:hypothetical protein
MDGVSIVFQEKSGKPDTYINWHLHIGFRLTRCVCEKVAQNVAKLIFVKIINNFYRRKSRRKI